jgi:Protein of unknown function (DUF3300)
VDQQSWDPSVKALTQFPSVLDNLAHNLSWTSSLGQAFANQQADVMAAVQTMRTRAQAAGTLQSNRQITVSTPATNTIVIQPANPQGNSPLRFELLMELLCADPRDGTSGD